MSDRPDELVELRTVVNELEAGVLESVLAEAGIPASHRTANGYFLGAFGMTSLNPSTVLVRREDVERANAALAANQSDSVDIDWNDVDVGEPEDAIAREIAAGSGQKRGLIRRLGWMGILSPIILIALLVFGIPVMGAVVGTTAAIAVWCVIAIFWILGR